MDKGVQAGQKIILTGWIGLDGMQVVMDKKEREAILNQNRWRTPLLL